MLPEFTLIFALILANGFFAAAEMAVVAARRTRLQAQAEAGDEKAARVLATQEKPSDFLAAVQIGITLVGTLASAVGGVEVTRIVTPFFQTIPGLAPYAETLALGLVVVLISYASLVFGEIVPKRLALRDPEKLAAFFIAPLTILSRLTSPFIRVLAASSDLMLRILGLTPKETPSSSPEEIELIIKQGAADGVIEPVEQELISAIFNYADRRLWDVMTPRTSMVALEADLSPAEALQIAQEHGFSRFPVYEGNLDNILGYVHVKDIIWADQSSNLRQAIREIVHIPGGMPLPAAFSTLTRAGKHMAIVLDEYGGTDGLLTLEDLLEVIVGEIEDEHSPLAYQPKVRPGEWVFNGATPIAEIEEILDVDFKSQGVYVTLAGFILNELGAIPAVGASIEKHGYRFTVQEMVNLRISAVLVQVTN